MADELEFRFTPFGEQREILLTPALISDVLAVRTKKGRGPSKADVRIFLERCAAQGLNPYCGDAYLIGYDNDDDTATFSLITSHQAMLKRAEPHPKYDGLESGVVVILKALAGSAGAGLRDSKPTPEEIEAARANVRPMAELALNRPGELVYPDEIVIGGWARVFRNDRTRPAIANLTFSVYNTGYSRWKKDPGGMIVKCAEASALREAFPTTLGGLYIAQEMEALQHQILGLPDGREEQEQNRIIIPTANSMPDDRRACVPTGQRPKVHDAPKTIEAGAPPQGDKTEPAAAKSSDTDRKEGAGSQGGGSEPGDFPVPKTGGGDQPSEPALPAGIADLLKSIRASKTETSLSLQKLKWRDLKAQFPDHVERVDQAFQTASERVTPAGGKPAS